MTIIAAVDFSPLSSNAARTAARLARKLDDRLLLVHVYEPPSQFYPELYLAGSVDVDVRLREARLESLAGLRDSLAGDFGVEVDARTVIGRPAAALAATASEENARLIVMGANAHGAVHRFIVGSVAQKTILEAPCPVLAVREGPSPLDWWLNGERPLRLLVGVDRSPATDAALAFVAAFKAAGPCEITLLHEYWPPAAYARFGLRGPRELGQTDPEIVGLLDKELRPHAELALGRPVNLVIKACWGRIGDGLALDAEAERADLLVVGTRQPHAWDHLASGSSALVSLRASSISVLCVPGRTLVTGGLSSESRVPVLKSVLVATDLSPAASAAVPHAYGLLHASGGKVDLCHVHERRLAQPVYVMENDSGLSLQERTEIDHALRALVPRASVAEGVTTDTHIIDGGAVAEEILALAHRLGSEAIVVGSHGRSGLGRVLLGSVAESVVRGSEVPVYVVRSGRAAG